MNYNPRSMKLTFPNWGYLQYKIITAYNLKNLEKVNSVHFSRQYKMLESLLNSNKNTLEVSFELLSRLQSKLLQSENRTDVSSKVKTILDSQLLNDQFITIVNIIKGDFVYVSDNMMDILNIEKPKFNLKSQILLDHTNKFYHPEDILHFLRYVNISYLMLTIDGFTLRSLTDYARLKYRLKTNNKETFVVNKKSFVLSEDVEESSYFDSHLDIWTIENNDNFKNVEYEIVTPGKPEKQQFMQVMAFIYNARILGITVKDILFLNVLIKYKSCKKTQELFNKNLFDKHKIRETISLKYVYDSVYHLKKKLLKSLENQLLISELSSETIENMKLLKMEDLAGKLGLIWDNEEFLQQILQFTELEQYQKSVSND